MKTIKIWADTHSTGIFDSIGRFYDRSETTISERTWNALQKWVDEYDFIITMDPLEREVHTRKISELDNQGMQLMVQIKEEWKKDLKRVKI